MDGAPPEAKTLRDGRYVLLAPLGQGAQGTTWDAVDKREGRPVAIKAFDVRGARAWKDVELAEREARVLSELEHPLLPRYIEHFEADGVLYLVMEKVDGASLAAIKVSGGSGSRMSEKDVTRLLRDADQVLAYLHGRSPPVIHRDIKPSNVIRRPDGSFAFVDFGAVRDHLRPEGGSTVVGTFGYMAPEQFQGRAGPASDVYAVGATAIAMLTGKEPEKLPHRGLSLDVHAALGKNVSDPLQSALMRMLDPDPDTRATRIGPLLDRRHPSAPPRHDQRADEAWAQGYAAIDMGIRTARDARRAARRAAKHAEKQARHAWRRRRPSRLPFPLRVLFGVALAVAQIWVILVLQTAVPLALTLLSIVFGGALRRAAEQVRLAGGRVGEELGDARGHVQNGWGALADIHVRPGERAPSTSEPRARVATPMPRVRYEPEKGEPDVEDDPDVDEEPERRRRTRQ